MNSFDIIGPVMVGPSSSHTAGAVKIGNISQKLLGTSVRKALFLPPAKGMARTGRWLPGCWAFLWTIRGFPTASAMQRRPIWISICPASTWAMSIPTR